MDTITVPYFKKRFVSLILGARNLPKKQADMNILLLSAVLKLDPERAYAESELNEELQKWSAAFGENFGLDHVTLRRYLVDGKLLERDPAGDRYSVGGNPPFSFEPTIRELDLEDVVMKEIEAQEIRKQQYLKKKQE